jgi:anaerobic selenocysteine-containing dehydrogenase
MKIDRRSFLSFVIGGAAGTALSPLPWKLIDDSAIWSQNWPWTPVPEKGEATYVNSACTLCPGGCGITVRKIGDRVVKIEGMKGHPVNDGGICELGTAGTQLLYSPTRVKTPLKKVNGKWRRISWEDALAEIAEKLGQLRSNGLSHSVACISDTDRGTVAELWNRFLRVYGSPNFIRTPSIQDNYEQALYMTQGVRAMPGFDLKNADFILSFGSGLIEGWQSPVYMFRAKSALVEKNGKMKQVEPRLSKTAAKSSQWLPITPGTEGALALGLCHVIIKERLYHRDFVENYSAGLTDRKRMVFDAYPPELVSKMTGIDAGIITALAREFARARKPIAICGRGKGQVPGGLQEFLAVHMLNALVGNIGQPGGIQAVAEPDYINWPEPEMDEVAAGGFQHARLDGAGGTDYPHARYLLNRLPEVIKSSQQSPVQMLFICEANPAYSAQDSQSMIEALEKIPLVVSFSSFMDETAVHADLILPNHIYLERLEDVPAAAGFPRPIISFTWPVIEPLYNTRHVGDVIIQLAKAMGGAVGNAFAWDSYEACLGQTLGDRWDVLVEQGFWENTDFSQGRWADAFETDSSKFEFAGSQINALPAYNPVSPPGDESFYPLVLVPYDSMRLASGYIGSPPFLIKALEATILKGNDVLVEVNPATAAKYGLKDGRQTTLSTPRGKAVVKVHVFDGIMPGVIAIARGLGHTAYDKFLAHKGASYNALSAVVEDPATGLDAAWGIRAKLGKA